MENESIIWENPALPLNLRTIDITQDISLKGLHIHKEIEIIRAEDGDILCIAEGEEIPLNRGEHLIISSRVTHCIKAVPPAKFTYLQVDMSRYSDSLFLFSSKQYDKVSSESEPARAFANIEKELYEKKPYYKTYINSYIYALSAYMHRNGFFSSLRESESRTEFKKILPALMYIEDNFLSAVSLEEICDTFHISKFYFCKLIKKITGQTFTEYVNILRIDEAEARLSRTDKNIAEIAFECGFNSIQYFNRLFKKYKSRTPKEYRNSIKGI